jgi:hypothetical protein
MSYDDNVQKEHKRKLGNHSERLAFTLDFLFGNGEC